MKICALLPRLAMFLLLTALCLQGRALAAPSTLKMPVTANATKRDPAMPLDELGTRLESYADNVFSASHVPGMAIALAHGDEIILEKVYGVRNQDTGEPVTRDTVFPLASLSKGMAGISAALVQLESVQNDALTFDTEAPLQAALPEFQVAEPWVSRHMTPADCMSHRTGMPPDTGEQLKTLFGYSDWEIFGRFRRLKLTQQFRNDFTYQNYVFTLGPLAAAHAAGFRTWGELAHDRLFIPLGMNATTSFDAYTQAKNRAVPHILQPDGFAPHDLPKREDQDAASGVFASLADMERWSRVLATGGIIDGERVLPAEALELAFEPRNLMTTSGPTATMYGLGWQITYANGARIVHHQGSFSDGVNTVVALLPDYDLCLVVLTNGFMVGVPGALKSKLEELAISGGDTLNPLPQHMELARSMLQTIAESYGRMPPPPAIPRKAAAPERYTGVYDSEYWGQIVIEPDGASGDLLVIFGESSKRHALRHYDGDTFSMDVSMPLAGPDAVYPTPVEFTCPKNKPCESVRFGRLDIPGRSGVFLKSTLHSAVPTPDCRTNVTTCGHDARRDIRTTTRVP